MCGRRRLRRQERALDVHPKHAVPVVLVGDGDRARAVDARVVVEHVESRRSSSTSRADCRADLAPRLPRPPRCATARPPSLRRSCYRGLGRRVGREVEHADRGALARRSASAAARPIPEPAPVMSATLPANRRADESLAVSSHSDRPPSVDDQRGAGHVAEPVRTRARRSRRRCRRARRPGPVGIFASTCSAQLGHVEAPLRHRSCDEAGADGVGRMPVLRVVGREGFGEHQRGALRRGVGAPAGERDLAGHRRHGDDMAAALGEHHRQRRPRAEERAAGVDREHPVPLLDRGLVADRRVGRSR